MSHASCAWEAGISSRGTAWLGGRVGTASVFWQQRKRHLWGEHGDSEVMGDYSEG